MNTADTQPITPPYDHSSPGTNDQHVTAREWFASGARRAYDPIAKTMLDTARGGDESSHRLHVFEKVVATPPASADTRWLTMLPGYPDGSYGYAQVDQHHVPGVFESTLRAAQLFSPSYEVTSGELADLSDAILRRGDGAFMHRAAGFVDEHRRNATRWDLAAIVRELGDTVAFHVAGSEEDSFEPRQIVAARERLGPFGVDVQWFPGGHLTTFEHPGLLADAIRGLARAHGVG